MNATAPNDVLSEEKSYSILSKVECIFAAIWHNPSGLIRTEDVAKYYEVSPDEVSDILKSHWDEFGEEVKAGWTPRAAIRLGMVVNSPTATKVRSLALDVIEAHKQPTKRAAVKFLLENAQFIDWSNRSIARILECSPTVVGDARKELEAKGKILKFEKRKYLRGGKEVKLQNKDSTHPFDWLLDKSLVYIIQAGDTNLFKIGCTDNLKKRIQGISTVCPQNPEVRYYILCENIESAKKIEQLFHQEFASSRARENAEWFALTNEDINKAENIAIENSLVLHAFCGQMQPSKPDSTVTTPQPKVRVSSPSHLRFGQEGIVTGSPENKTHLFVSFPDCPSELVAIADLDGESAEYPTEEEGKNPSHPPSLFPSSPFRLPSPRTYTEDELSQEINRAIAEAKLGFKVEMEELALAQVQEQLIASGKFAERVRDENIKLQLQLEQMESLRLLESENKKLQERNQELEKALSQKPMERWDITPSAAKILNKNVEKALKNTIDLQSLAESAPPEEDASRCLHLMGLALGNLAKSINNTQAMSAAAILLGCAPNPSAIALTIERTQMVAAAVADIRKVISVPGCTFEVFWQVASEYETIKKDYWAKFSKTEKDFIRTIKDAHDAVFVNSDSEIPGLSPIQVGAIVSSSNINSQLYLLRGVVTEEINSEEVSVLWNHDSEAKPKRYFKEELRIAEKELQTV